ncbi:MAG: DNA replication/repair protein RecF [Fibrobacteres bacterium]|nr:DNA replication/repair protein RecF [Fibrobacterota bacterium]
MAHFQRLDLYNFRSWKSYTFEPAPKVSLITGPNGSGKTNILEALFYAVMAKSFRHARLREMVTTGEKEFSIRIKAESHARTHDLKVSGTIADHSFELDGHRLKSVGELVGRFPVMVFSPDDLAIAAGAPVERRRFLNMLISQCSSHYFHTLLKYNRTLHQRNATLKLQSTDRAYLSVLTESLIIDGAAIRKERRDFVKRLELHGAGCLKTISGESLSLSYHPGNNKNGDETALLKEEASLCSVQETMERTTLFGPHTDDLKIRLQDKEARKFGSRGQIRSIVLALKMGGVSLLEESSGEKCILLLDDLFSELDDSRSEELMHILQGERQAIIAMPKRAEWMPLSEPISVYNTTD